MCGKFNKRNIFSKIVCFKLIEELAPELELNAAALSMMECNSWLLLSLLSFGL